MAKKSVTTDELAVMINTGFDAVDKRFNAIDKRFGSVEKRLDGLEINAREVNDRLSHMGREISEIHKHLVYRDEFNDLMDRVKYLETKLGVESGK